MSQPNWRRQLALALTLFALGGFAYWHEFKHKPEAEESEEKAKKILALDKNQVESIRITNGARAFSLECADLATKMCKPGDNAKWQLTDPVKVKADDSNSNSLVSTINNLVVSDTISLKDETPEKKAALLKEYGLDPATLPTDRKLEIKSSAGISTLYLGQTHPIGDGIFSALGKDGKLDEDQIYVLPSYLKASFDHDLSFWRDKKVLPVAAHEIESFSLKSPKGDIKGSRKNGVWTLTSKGDEVTGDNEAMDTLLTGVTYLVAKDFTDKKALQGAKPVITFSIKKEKVEEPITMTLYQKPSGKPPAKGVVQYRVFATVSTLDPVFELEGYAKERLLKELKDLRLSKLVTSMDKFSAKRLELSSAGLGPTPWVLVSKDSKWQSGAGEPIDSEKVQNFLDHLGSAKIQDFIAKALPQESGGLQITLGDDSNPAKRKIALWRAAEKTGQKLYAKDLLSGRKEVFLMDNSLSEALPWDKVKLEKNKQPGPK
jgi:hypothetical protein